MAIKRISRAFGIILSFRPHPVTKDLTILRNENAIKRSVRNLVQTIPTERFFNSVLGSMCKLIWFVDYGTASTIEPSWDCNREFWTGTENLCWVLPVPDLNEFEVTVFLISLDRNTTKNFPSYSKQQDKCLLLSLQT